MVYGLLQPICLYFECITTHHHLCYCLKYRTLLNPHFSMKKFKMYYFIYIQQA